MPAKKSNALWGVVLVFMLVGAAFAWYVKNQAKVFSVPESYELAGEAIPLQDPEIAERFKRELVYTFNNQGLTVAALYRLDKYRDTIKVILEEEGLPVDLMYVPAVESKFELSRSAAGAAGYWQLMPGTATEHGLQVDAEVDERYHLAKSTRAAAKVFKQYYRKLGSYSASLAAYNCGIGAFERHASNQSLKGKDVFYDLFLNTETSRYVFLIAAMKYADENRKYFSAFPESTKSEELRAVAVKQSVPDWANWAKNMGCTYKSLKACNPWLRARKLTLTQRGSYTVMLPVNCNIHSGFVEGAAVVDSVNIDSSLVE